MKSGNIPTILPTAVFILTTVLAYWGLVELEAWTIETLCRELLRCT